MNSPLKGSVAVRIFLILIAALFLIGMITSTAAAVPGSVTSDGNYWYQTITINGDTAETNGLYHAAVPFPYNFSLGHDNYRLYDSAGNPVQFHIFGNRADALSLSFKSNMNAGNNIFYLTGGNESMSNVQSTSIYGAYREVPTLNANATYSTGNYNFGQIKALGISVNSLSRSYGFYNSSSNYTLDVSSRSGLLITLNTSASNTVLDSSQIHTYAGYENPIYLSIGQTPAGGEFYTYSNSWRAYQTGTLDPFVTQYSANINSNFIGNSIRYNITPANSAVSTVNFTYATGMYSTYESITIDSPRSISDFMVLNIMDQQTGKVLQLSEGFLLPGESTYTITSSNANSSVLRGSLLPSATNTRPVNITVSGQLQQKYVYAPGDNESIIDLRTMAVVSDGNPSNVLIQWYNTGFVNVTIPQSLFESNLLQLTLSPETTNIPNGFNRLFVQVVDKYGNAIESPFIELYYLGSQLTGTATGTRSGATIFRATNGAGHTILAESLSYVSNVTNVVTNGGNASTSTTYAIVVLESYQNITISVRDYDTLEQIQVFTAYLGETQRIASTDNGTVEFLNVTSGPHDVVLVSEGYNQVSRRIEVSRDNTHFNLYMSKSDGSGGGGSEQITTPQYITFYIRNQINSPISGALIEIYEKGADSDDVMMSKTTGSDGAATFSFNRTLEYRVVVTKDGVQATHNISGSQNSFFTIYLKMPASVALLPANQVTSASISVSKYNDSSSGYAALLTLRIRSTNGGTIGINPSSISGSVNLQQISTNQTNTTYTVVYGITETQLKSFRENNFRIHYSGQATNSLGTGTFNFNVSYQFRIGGEGLLSIELPSNIKQGLAIGAALMILLAVVSVSTISLSYTSFLVTLVVGRWIGWVELHDLIWVFLALGLVLAVIYDMRVGVNS